MAICSVVRIVPASAWGRGLRGLALACAVIASATVNHAADLTWAPLGDVLGGGYWTAAGTEWADAGGSTTWDQTKTGVLNGVSTATAPIFPLYEAPLQAGLRVDAVSNPIFGYTGGATISGVSSTNNVLFYAGLDPVTGTTAPTYTLKMDGTPTIDTGTSGDTTLAVTTLMNGGGGYTKSGTGILLLRNPFSTFEGNVVISQGGVNVQANPPMPVTGGTSSMFGGNSGPYDYFNQLNAYSGTGSLASQPQPSAFGRADIARSVTINPGAYLYLQSNDSFGGAQAPASQITVNVQSGARLYNDFVGGASSTYGGVDPGRPSGGQRGPVTPMGAINLTSGSMNGAWGWYGPSGTSTQTQPISTGSQAWALRGTVTSSGSSTMNTALLSRGYNGGMHVYDTPFVVTDGTLNVPGQFFNPASSSTNTPSGFSKSGTGTMVISGNNWHSGTTTVLNGTLRVEGRKQPLKASTAFVNGANAKLELNSDQTMPYLRVFTGTASLPTEKLVTINSSTLSVNSGSGGLLDLGSGRVNWSAGMTATTLVDRIVTGRNGGGWNGTTGITSGSAASSGGTRAVGWVDNGGGALSVAFSAPGDTNIDGFVDVLDASNFISSGKYGAGPSNATWIEGDFNYDGQVDVLDAADFVQTNLYNGPTFLPAAAPGPPVKTETFTTNPNWTSFKTSGTAPTQAYATWSGTSPMGTGGAVGGSMYVYGVSQNRIGTYFADTTTFSGSNALNYSDTFFAKGNIYMTNTNFNGGLGVGFFNWEQVNGVTADGVVGVSGTTVGSQSTSFIGVQMAEPNSPAVTGPFRTWLYAAQNNNESATQNYSNSQAQVQTRTATSGTGMVQGVIVPFEFQWTGSQNGSGLLTGSINGQNLNVGIATPTYFGPWQMDAFGIVSGLGGSTIGTTLTTNIWVDNLVYGYGTLADAPSLPMAGGIAAVPEPAAWQALVAAVGVAGAAWRIRRRQP